MCSESRWIVLDANITNLGLMHKILMKTANLKKKTMKRTSRGLSTRIGLYNIENILTTEIWMSKMSQPVTAKTNTYSI